jgi:hypothetical protein
MIEEEYPISIEDLQKKFQKWFGKTVPAEPPVPAEIEQSMGKPVPIDLPLPAKVEHSIGKPVPVDLSMPAMAIDLDHEARNIHKNNSRKLSELLYLGFMGAVTSGAVIGFITFILDFGFPGWYSETWLSPFIIIFFALLLGFYIGLSKGYISQQREKYFFEGEF